MSTTTTTALLEAATLYHTRGWPVIAVASDKRPMVDSWGQWRTQRQTPTEIQSMPWKRAHGIALLTWPASNLIVVDFDGPHAHAAWRTTGIELTETAITHTRSGGTHHLYRVADGVQRLTEGIGEPRRKVRVVSVDCECTDGEGKRKPCGVDILINGYAIAPPAPGYAEDPDHPLDPTAISIIPPVILDLARATNPIHFGQDHASDDAWFATALRGPIRQGQRNATAARLAGLYVAKGLTVD